MVGSGDRIALPGTRGDLLLDSGPRLCIMREKDTGDISEAVTVSESTGKTGETEPLIRDEDAAIRIAGGNADLAQELFTAFLDGLHPHVEGLRTLHRAGDWPELCNEAHRLHGSAAYCGVPALKSAVKRLELAASAGDRSAIDAGIETLGQEMERLLVFAAKAPGKD